MISYTIERDESGDVKVTLNGNFKSIAEAMKLIELVESMSSKYTPLQQQIIALMQSGQKLLAVKDAVIKSCETCSKFKDCTMVNSCKERGNTYCTFFEHVL